MISNIIYISKDFSDYNLEDELVITIINELINTFEDNGFTHLT